MLLQKLQIDKIPLDDQETWDLICSGNTRGCFQLESPLGRHWCKTIKPRTIEELSDVISVIRPGVLESFSGDPPKNLTRHYSDRKHGLEEDNETHPALKEILKSTHSILVFQEQQMSIASKLAGFSETEADSLRKCITDDTYFISKTRGWISIKELLQNGYENDDFLIMDENGKQQWKKIEKIWYTGLHDINSIETQSGMFVNATQYHQFLTNNGWKARIRLSEEDFIVCVKEIEYDGIDKISLDMAIIITGLLTEGYFVGYSHGATFVSYDDENMKIFENAFFRVFNRKKSNIDDKVFTIHKSEKEIINQYLKYGKSGEKEIPSIMMGMTKETTRQFLSFMFECECGITISSKQLEYTSKSKKMIQQIQLLLLRFGIRSYMNLKYDKKYGNFYRLYINDFQDQQKFKNELSCNLSTRKLEQLRTILEQERELQYTTDIIPTNIVQKFTNQYPQTASYEGGSIYSKSISRQRLKRIINKTNDNNWKIFINGKQQYSKIKSFNKIRQQKTYDFTIQGENTPYIIANGLVIHNSVGKKDQKLMSSLKDTFINGCKKIGILNEEQSKEVFEWIKAGARYSFCKAHATSYAVLGYRTAYCKTHFPIQFYCAYLTGANWKQDTRKEIRELVEDAKKNKVEIKTPDLRELKDHFYIKDDKVYFGIGDIKDIGGSALKKIKTNIINFNSWFEYIIKFSDKVSTTVNTALISSGSLDYFKISRQKMLFELDLWNSLTEKEKEHIINIEWNPPEKVVLIPSGLYNLQFALQSCFENGCKNVKRREVLSGLIKLYTKPPYSLEDKIEQIVFMEEKYLGAALTYSRLDASNQAPNANFTCAEIIEGKGKKNILIAVEITRVKEIICKNGEKMAFLEVSDNTGNCNEIVIFSDSWKEYKDILYISNLVMLHCYRGTKGLIVNRGWQI